MKFGLLGKKLSHSFSPVIHDFIFNEMNIEGSYDLYERSESEIKELLDRVRSGEIKGLNVTVPYKQEVMQYLDKLSERADAIGAVNTIYFKNGKLIGDNTDYYGFTMTMVDHNIDVRDKHVTLLGNGGAAKAVIKSVLDQGAKKIDIYDLEYNVKDENPIIDIYSYNDLAKANGELLVQCTPIGMYPKVGESLAPVEVVKKFNSIIDLIYNPWETKILQDGRKNGLKTVNGLYMLVGQAIKAQEIWNDREFSKDMIDKIYKNTEKKVRD